ncbi:MAG: prepilin peptidase [Planctomycetes bacterium]|nr:prepilin peptidase [Planctomycetota bacterium]
MDYFATLGTGIVEHWPVWLVTFTLILAAVIDGARLRVPNWITFPLILSGWACGGLWFGWAGLGASFAASVVGLLLLLPAYAIGGMGAGDVKLLAGVGAWMVLMLEACDLSVSPTSAMFVSFGISAVVGAVIAIAMTLWRRAFAKHANQFWMILGEILTIRNPTQLAEIAADRKPSMLLLPYGIPIAIGTIAYFCWMGMLL